MNNQRKNQDKKLRSGERQVRNKLETIEYWHKWRYNEALKYIEAGDKVLDLGMGCGYGSYILSTKAKEVIGIDDSQEAVNYAKTHWKKDNIKYCCDSIFNVKGNFDVVVAFEIIEHIKDVDKLFDLIGQWTKKRVILSVPHTSVPLSRSRWHWKHFEAEEIEKYIKDRGFEIERIETPTFGKGLAIFCVGKREDDIEYGVICPCGEMMEDYKKRGFYKIVNYNKQGRIVYAVCFHDKIVRKI